MTFRSHVRTALLGVGLCVVLVVGLVGSVALRPATTADAATDGSPSGSIALAAWTLALAAALGPDRPPPDRGLPGSCRTGRWRIGPAPISATTCFTTIAFFGMRRPPERDTHHERGGLRRLHEPARGHDHRACPCRRRARRHHVRIVRGEQEQEVPRQSRVPRHVRGRGDGIRGGPRPRRPQPGRGGARRRRSARLRAPRGGPRRIDPRREPGGGGQRGHERECQRRTDGQDRARCGGRPLVPDGLRLPGRLVAGRRRDRAVHRGRHGAGPRAEPGPVRGERDRTRGDHPGPALLRDDLGDHDERTARPAPADQRRLRDRAGVFGRAPRIAVACRRPPSHSTTTASCRWPD